MLTLASDGMYTAAMITVKSSSCLAGLAAQPCLFSDS